MKRILISSTFGENTIQGVTKCKNKRRKICGIIIVAFWLVNVCNFE